MVPPRFKSHALGSGPVVIELWFDYICPFSAKMFKELRSKVFAAGESKFPGQLQWVFRHQTQPWHPQGAWLHEVGIAVGLVAPDKFWDFSAQLFDRQREFFDEQTVDKSRTVIIGSVIDIAAGLGIDRGALTGAVRIDSGEGRNAGPPIIPDVKYYARLGRQNGIHVTPTVVINGTVDPEISSSWDADQWAKKLQTVTEHAYSTKI